MIMAVLGETLILGLIVGGATLMIAEAIIPGTNFVVLGVAMLITGIVAQFLPSFASPIVLPFVFLFISGVTLYFYHNYQLYGEEKDQTSDAESLEYKSGVVVEKVTPTEGKVRIDGNTGSMTSNYQARCEQGEIEEGTKIIVTDSGGGTILQVMPSSESEMDRMLGLEKEVE